MDRDPTPGDPDEVRELSEELQEFADDVGEALGKIRGLASERAVLDWAGLSADAFRREFEGVPDNLTKLEDSYALSADALNSYWPKLQTAQGMADRALDRANLRAGRPRVGPVRPGRRHRLARTRRRGGRAASAGGRAGERRATGRERRSGGGTGPAGRRGGSHRRPGARRRR
ncbi:WXG100 family type VII secretion target [Streptomyces triticirhizae]|uniref:WXG100 family type VII secretion target n=1 Tax=Streptomyces triticirhizae TaxID=2483353 RepID=UPI00389A7191